MIEKVDKIEKQISWCEKQTQHSFVAHLFSSLLIFWIVGFVMLLIDSDLVLSQLTSHEIIDQLIQWTSIGLIFGISNRWYLNFQIKRLRKKKARLLAK